MKFSVEDVSESGYDPNVHNAGYYLRAIESGQSLDPLVAIDFLSDPNTDEDKLQIIRSGPASNFVLGRYLFIKLKEVADESVRGRIRDKLLSMLENKTLENEVWSSEFPMTELFELLKPCPLEIVRLALRSNNDPEIAAMLLRSLEGTGISFDPVHMPASLAPHFKMLKELLESDSKSVDYFYKKQIHAFLETHDPEIFSDSEREANANMVNTFQSQNVDPTKGNNFESFVQSHAELPGRGISVYLRYGQQGFDSGILAELVTRTVQRFVNDGYSKLYSHIRLLPRIPRSTPPELTMKKPNTHYFPVSGTAAFDQAFFTQADGIHLVPAGNSGLSHIPYASAVIAPKTLASLAFWNSSYHDKTPKMLESKSIIWSQICVKDDIAEKDKASVWSLGEVSCQQVIEEVFRTLKALEAYQLDRATS